MKQEVKCAQIIDFRRISHTVGPTLGEIPLDLKGKIVDDSHIKVSIVADMSKTNGQLINVHFGYTPYVANITMKDGVEYSTFYAPFTIEHLPEGIKAYTCSKISNKSLKLDELPGDGVRAYTPVILKRTSENKPRLYQNYYNFDENLKVRNGQYGLLCGVAGSQIIAPKGSYILQMNGSMMTFYLVDGSSTVYVASSRCYLLPDKSGIVTNDNSSAYTKYGYIEPSDFTTLQAQNNFTYHTVKDFHTVKDKVIYDQNGQETGDLVQAEL